MYVFHFVQARKIQCPYLHAYDGCCIVVCLVYGQLIGVCDKKLLGGFLAMS